MHMGAGQAAQQPEMKHQTWRHPTLMTLSDALRISISPVAAIACSLAMLSDEAAAAPAPSASLMPGDKSIIPQLFSGCGGPRRLEVLLWCCGVTQNTCQKYYLSIPLPVMPNFHTRTRHDSIIMMEQQQVCGMSPYARRTVYMSLMRPAAIQILPRLMPCSFSASMAQARTHTLTTR
jgi:hypothetical protein